MTKNDSQPRHQWIWVGIVAPIVVALIAFAGAVIGARPSPQAIAVLPAITVVVTIPPAPTVKAEPTQVPPTTAGARLAPAASATTAPSATPTPLPTFTLVPSTSTPPPPTATRAPRLDKLIFCDDSDFERETHRCMVVVEVLPVGAKRLFYTFHAYGMTPGAPYAWKWLRNGQPLTSGGVAWGDKFTAEIEWSYLGCKIDAKLSDCGPLPPGEYHLFLYIDGRRAVDGVVIVPQP